MSSNANYGDDRQLIPVESDSQSTGRAAMFRNQTGTSGTNHNTRKRARGRPIGSKNRPKPPIVIREAARMRILITEPGNDVADRLWRYHNSLQGVGMHVIGAEGDIANVIIKPTWAEDAPVIQCHGRLQLLAVSAFLVPRPVTQAMNISVWLARRDGVLIGGVLMGQLIAASTVALYISVFENPIVELPYEDDGGSTSASGGGRGNGKESSEVPVHENHEDRRHMNFRDQQGLQLVQSHANFPQQHHADQQQLVLSQGNLHEQQQQQQHQQLLLQTDANYLQQHQLVQSHGDYGRQQQQQPVPRYANYHQQQQQLMAQSQGHYLQRPPTIPPLRGGMEMYASQDPGYASWPPPPSFSDFHQ